MTKSLEDALNLPAIQEEEITDSEIPASNTFEAAEDNLANAMDIAKKALTEIASIASSSQHPSAYAALKDMLKTYADLSMAPVDLELKKQRLNKGNDSGKPIDAPVVNQNLFVGSTTELLQLLQNMNKDAEQQ